MRPAHDRSAAVLILGTFALLHADLALPQGLGGASIEQRTVVTVSARPLPPAAARPPRTGSAAADGLTLTLGPAEQAEGSFDVAIDGRAVRVRLRVTRLDPTSGAGTRLVVRAESAEDGGATVSAERTIAVDERATALFEIRRDGDVPLTLGIVAVVEPETVVRTTPRIGLPLAFEIEILRVDGDRETSLETNLLRTFEHQSVSYRFRIGSPPVVESLDLSLTPRRVRGGIVDVDVDVTGTVPGGDAGPVGVARQERWVTTDGSTSSFSLVGGDPPRGYRVLVTPRL